METKWNYSLTLLFLLFFTLSGFSQSFLSEIGLEPKEGSIWVEECKVPAIHQLSDTLAIKGNFDGISGNTRLIIDGQLLVPVWENREKAMFLVRHLSPGKQSFSITDQRLSAEGSLQLIQINQYFSHTDLKKGEVTDLKVEVKGLDGWDQPLTLQIRNHSNEDFSLSAGDKQEWAMDPGQAAVKKVLVNCLEKRPGPLKVAVQLIENKVDTNPQEEIAVKR